MSDYYKRDEDKRKEIDDFLNEFDKMDRSAHGEKAYGRSEINDKFDQLSSGLKGYSQDPYGLDEGTSTSAAQRVAARRAEAHAHKRRSKDSTAAKSAAKKEAAQAKRDAAHAKKEAVKARAKAKDEEMADMTDTKKKKPGWIWITLVFLICAVGVFFYGLAFMTANGVNRLYYFLVLPLLSPFCMIPLAAKYSLPVIGLHFLLFVATTWAIPFIIFGTPLHISVTLTVITTTLGLLIGTIWKRRRNKE